MGANVSTLARYVALEIALAASPPTKPRPPPIPPRARRAERSTERVVSNDPPPQRFRLRAPIQGAQARVDGDTRRRARRERGARRPVQVRRRPRAPSGAPRASAADATDAAASSEEARLFFAGDIGGTNARLQVWRSRSADDGRPSLVFEKTYGTSDHPTFESCVSDLYADSGVDLGGVSAACFAVAGPVAENRCDMTNLSWVVDGPALEAMFDIENVRVINDFAAVGYGVLDLKPEDVVTLNEGKGATKDDEENRGPVAVLGPGTGLGEAMLFFDETLREYAVVPSEGSHADFAPRGETQRALLAYCEETLGGECEIEQVCCGSGIVRVYDFLRTYRAGGEEKPDLDPAGVTDAALDGTCDLCVEAVDIFLRILGAEAANLALKCLATGGVYVAGGIPPRLMKIIGEDGGPLLEGFLHKKCRYAGVREGFPLKVILNDKIGLAGAKVFAMRQLHH